MAEPVRRALVPALHRLEAKAEAEGMPPGARHRVAARLREEAARREASAAPRGWLPALTFVAGAALVMLVVGSGAPGAPTPVTTGRGEEGPRQLGAFTVSGDGCRPARAGEQTVLRGRCRLASAAMVVETWDETRLVEGPSGLRVLLGTALFEVGKVPAGAPPVRVEVSHGAIEVLGTRFAVEQGSEGGHVDLFEGRIRFVSGERPREVRPGQRLGWGDRAQPVRVPDAAAAAASRPAGPSRALAPGSSEAAAPSTPPRSSSTPRRAASPPPGPTADAIIEEVASLRAQGRYREAASVLRRALRRHWDARTAEVLSYELGRILDRQLHDRAAACAHFAGHAERFGDGRYADAVRDTLARCEG